MAAATIGSDDIIDGQVKTRDLGSQAVTSGKLDSSAVTSAHVKNRTLKQADIKAPVIKTPTFLNNWENYDQSTAHPVKFWKDAMGIVHLEGAVQAGTTLSDIFTLPVGYRPADNYVDFPVITASGAPGDFDATIGYVEVEASGDVLFAEGLTGYVALDSISFRAGD